MKRSVYEITDLKLDNYHLLLNEALFHNANGYIGVRSVFEEGYPEGFTSVRGQYINGFYDTAQLRQAERLYGLVDEKQTMLSVADTQTIRLIIGDETFSMFSGTVLQSRRTLDMDAGVTTREVTWRSPKGKELSIMIRRMACFHQLSLFTIEYTVTPLNFSGELMFSSEHNGNVINFGDPADPRTAEEYARYLTPLSCEIKQGASFITSRTSKSGLSMCSCVKNVIRKEHERLFYVHDNNAICELTVHAQQDEAVTLVKYAVFCDSIRCSDCRARTAAEMDAALAVPLQTLYEQQARYLAEYWTHCSVEVDCDGQMSQAILYNLYQLIQSVGKDEHCCIAPKGLSGEGYEGHYFWDSEMYIHPYFVITNPDIARRLIEYRYATLEMARENAKKIGHEMGALYPWRTITGRECSGYFPAGTAQYHINGAVAYAIIAYYLATGDLSLIETKGAEILFETARLWMDTGNFCGEQFHINDVTGPDEYTCLVNNNYYTNLLAQYHLQWAVKIYRLLGEKGALQPLIDKIGIRADEIDGFARAAQGMVLPYDAQLDINPQDDSFLQKQRWEVKDIPKNKRPLLMHYHPLHLYRRQVCKQPDTVLAHFILEDAQSEQTIRNSYEYYEKITTHDSSLSTCVFSIMAAKLKMEKKAMDYFGNSARLDLLDLQRNTKDGIHTANMGGTYMAIVYGFGGFRLKESGIWFAPMLPSGWSGYRFKIRYRDSRIAVAIHPDVCEFRLESGAPKDIFVYGQPHTLGGTLSVPRQGEKHDEALQSCDL